MLTRKSALRIFSFVLSLQLVLLPVPRARAVEGAVPLFKPEASCARTYIYHSRTFPMDSSRKKDGEGMRAVLKSNAQAETMLNDYQHNVSNSAVAPILGFSGLALGIGGFIGAGYLSNANDQKAARFASIGVIVLSVLGAYGYGIHATRMNEKRLEKAVQTYNDAAPERDKIRVEVVPTTDLKGGEIKTQVPFL